MIESLAGGIVNNPLRDAIEKSDILYAKYEMDRKFVEEFSNAVTECNYEDMDRISQEYSLLNEDNLQLYMLPGTKIREILVSTVDTSCHIWEYDTPEEYNQGGLKSYVIACHIPHECKYIMKWTQDWEILIIFENILSDKVVRE